MKFEIQTLLLFATAWNTATFLQGITGQLYSQNSKIFQAGSLQEEAGGGHRIFQKISG